MINFYNVDKSYISLATDIYNAVLKHFNQDEDIFEIDLEGVDRERIHEVNLQERGVDRATDVLSFQYIENIKLPCKLEDYPFDVDYDTKKIFLGDILVCIDIMKEQAIEYNHSEQRELAYLTLHGILHLLGFDHMKEEDKAVMRSHEEAVLNSLNITR